MDIYTYVEQFAVDNAYIALGLAVALTVAATAVGITRAVDLRRERRWELCAQQHYIEQWEQAEAENRCLTALQVLEDRKYHYRHNLHCPACGRFARQAQGLPTGVTDCRYHGVRVRVTEFDTGPIAIFTSPVVVPETSPLELEAPTPASEHFVEAIVTRSLDHLYVPDDEIVVYPELELTP